MTNTRLWHVTLSWRHRKQRYEQEIVLCAPDKDTACNMAKNRIPMHLLEQDDASDTVQIRTRDLGLPQNHKTYFASKMQASAKEKDAIPLNLQVALTFAILWGHETGYRAGNPYVSVTETDQMNKLHDLPEKERKIYDWAQEYLSDNTTQPKEFFRKKLSELLNDTITDIEQLTSTVVLTDIDSAEQQARTIIEQAKTKAIELLDGYQTRVNDELNTALTLVENLKNINLSDLIPAIPKETEVITESMNQPEQKATVEAATPDISEQAESESEAKTQEPDTTAEPDTIKAEPESESNTEEPEQTDFNDTAKTKQPVKKKIYDEDLPFADNDPEESKIKKPVTKDPAEEIVAEEPVKSESKSDPSSESKEQTEEQNSSTNEKVEITKPKPMQQIAKKKLELEVSDLGSVTRLITTKDLKEDNVFKALYSILSIFTIDIGKGNQKTTRTADIVYETLCKKKDIDPNAKTDLNVDIMLDILNMTNRKNGKSGWDFAVSMIRSQFPGCNFSLPIPKKQTAA